MKRIFDLIIAAFILILTAPAMVFIAIAIWRQDGAPVLYIAERMKTPDQAFNLYKFRTMVHATGAQNAGVTGGDKSNRITPIGRTLRKYRLDELPQVFNVLRGDISFVGPRPPLRQYTDAFPEIYAQVLKSRPGITGLATLHFHRHEERLIAAAKSQEETEKIYTRRCIPRKASLDLIYTKHESVCFDFVIMSRTIMSLIRR